MRSPVRGHATGEAFRRRTLGRTRGLDREIGRPGEAEENGRAAETAGTGLGGCGSRRGETGRTVAQGAGGREKTGRRGWPQPRRPAERYSVAVASSASGAGSGAMWSLQ